MAKGPTVFEPHNQARKCTDPLCVVLLILAIGGAIAIGAWATINGDVNKLTHGYNYEGELCGVDNDDPVMFWCESTDDPGSLDFQHPVCRSSCPTSTDTSGSCFGSAVDVGFHTSDVADYPTHEIGGAFCLPNDISLLHQASTGLASTDLSIIMDIALLEEAKSIILEAVGISLVLLAIYVCVLPVAAQIMISISVIIIVLLSVAIGTIIVVKYCGGLGGDVDGDETTANTAVDLIVGLACFVFAAVVCCCSCWLRPKLETAKDLLQLSVLFLIESPDVVVLILLKFIVTIGLVAVMLGFGGMVLSTTELVSVGDTYQYEVEAETWVYFFVFLFLMYWIICTFRAWITFGIAFAVQMDYDRRRHGSGGLFGGLRGFSSGVKSIGSFTLAGLCKAVFGWNLGILNALMNFLGLSCLSPITFLDNISLSAMSHDGTLGFCAAGCSTAARQSRSSVLHSFNSIFELIGLLFIPPIGGICAYLLAQQSDMAKPLQVAILSALVNLIVVVPVLGAVTIIAEAFVYCDELFEEGEPEKETVVQKTKTFFAGSMKGEKGEDTDPLLAAKSSAKL